MFATGHMRFATHTLCLPRAKDPFTLLIHLAALIECRTPLVANNALDLDTSGSVLDLAYFTINIIVYFRTLALHRIID